MPILSAKDVTALYAERVSSQAPMHEAMLQFKAVYDGYLNINLPEMDKNMPSGVPNLAAQGVDQMAGRVAQTSPQFTFSPRDWTVRLQVRRAQTAGNVIAGWREMDRHKVKMAQRARHWFAYGMAPEVVTWDYKRKVPRFDVRNPIETYPSGEWVNSTTVPTDCIFAFRRTVGWLVDRGYGWAITAATGTNQLPQRDALMLLIEYVCEQGRALYLTGSWATPGTPALVAPNSYERGRAPQLIDMSVLDDSYVCVSIPSRITLDSPSGQYQKMLGMLYQQARLMALETIATEKGIFPDLYGISRPNEVFRITAGPYDGRSGKITEIAGGDIKEVSPQPSYMASQVIDRLERAQRLTAGLPQEFGGESGNNIRTGRRGDSILSNLIDFSIAEAQDSMAYGMEDTNRIAINLAKMYCGDEENTLFVGQGNNFRAVTYIPNQVFPDDEHRVTYPISGADQNALIIGMEQRVGSRGMSRYTAMTLDPWIANPEYEHDRIQYEGIEDAVLASLQAKANSGEIPLTAVVQIQQLILNDDMELGDAIVKVTEQAAAAAQQVPESGSAATPDQLAAAPTAQALTGTPPIPPPEAGATNLAGIFGALRGTRPLPQTKTANA